jgi:hypothetical protein
MAAGRRWMVHDRYGNAIYLTDERWKHIIEPWNHPEMRRVETQLQEVIRSGQRKQDTLNFQKYRYSMSFNHLSEDNTHIVAIVLFKFQEQDNRQIPNNYIMTAYQKEIR